MDRVRTKTWFAQTILKKEFGTKYRNPEKQDKARKV